MENMEDFCVSHKYTQRDLLLLLLLLLLPLNLLPPSLHPSHLPLPSPPSFPPTILLLPLYMYIHCFSELRRIILELLFARDYASRDKIYYFIHLALRNTKMRTRTPLEYYTITSNIPENSKLLCNYWRCY